MFLTEFLWYVNIYQVVCEKKYFQAESVCRQMGSLVTSVSPPSLSATPTRSDLWSVVFCIFYRSLCISIRAPGIIVYPLLPFPGGAGGDWRVPPCLVGLACHRPCRPPPPWLLPLLLYLLLLLGHPRLSLLLLQGVSTLPILPSYSI